MEVNTNPKCQQLLETARHLFKRYGMKRVTIEEICQTANVSKMTFYKFFKNKTDLARHLIAQMITENMSQYRAIMDQDIPFPEKVEQTIEMKLEQARDVSQEYFHDMTQTPDPQLTEFITGKRQEALQEVLRDYLEAQKRGDLREDMRPEFILYFLNHMVEMLTDERLVKLYDSPEELIIELTKFFFYGIMPRETGKR